MANISINMQLSPKQLDVLSGARRFTLWRAGRRSGKTHGMEYAWAKKALTSPNSINWYVAQDTALCKELNVPLFEKIVPHELIKDYSKSDRCFILYNNARCYFKSANSADSLRGRAINSLGCEEPAFWQNGFDIYHNILRPQLADTMGSCMLISSPPNKKAPSGAEWFRRLENSFKDEIKNGSQEYAVFQSNIWDNPFIIDEEKKSLQRTTDADTWQIEYMGEYCDKIGQVYWEFDPLIKKAILAPSENILMRVRGMDFGISDNTACAWINLLSGNRIHISDEYIANNLDVPTHARAIKGKTVVPGHWSVLDSSCWARDASLTSVAKRFAGEGIVCMQGTKDLDGSVSDMKLLFANGAITIDPSCTGLLQAIDDWQHGQHEPDILAAARYGIDALIRSGKLMHPVRPSKTAVLDHVQQFDEQEKRIRHLNVGLAAKQHGAGLRSFRIINP